MDFDDQEIIDEFVVECLEGIDQVDRDLVALEESPTDAELLGRIFRSMHTVKGTAGFLAFTNLESITHVGESLLSQLRDGVLLVNAEIISALLSTVDAVRAHVRNIEATGSEQDSDHTALIQTLLALQNADESPAATSQAKAPVGTPAPELQPEPKAEAAAGLTKQAPAGEVLASSQTRRVSDNHIRVDVRLLDKLMNLVGELVLARNQIVQFSQVEQEQAFATASQRLNLVTTELQEGIMKTRMQPIGTVWSKFPRVVRDLAVQCRKQVQISMEGKETELDKTLIEAIKDPLTHAVRNAIDHGIESPEERVAAGKPAEGNLTLRAYHEGGQVNIEISDDGGGIDVQKVRARAVEKGLISHDEAAVMAERESLGLLFRPGFSTATTVTNVSGRGVGMDVVKTSIEKIGGSVDVQTVLGQGSTLKIKIPLTLAIVPALLISCCGDCYAIPQISLLELVRLDGPEARAKVKSIHGTPVYRLRGQLLPLVSLSEQLELSTTSLLDDPLAIINIVVLQADDQQFGLIVDQINDTEEIVVKPLSEQLKAVKAFAGATIMGDGKVSLILDVLGLAEKSGVVSDGRDRRYPDKGQEPANADRDIESLLLFGIGEGRMALPLSQVERLEEFPRTCLETSAGRHVAQYRGEVLPLVHVSQVIDTPATPPSDGPLHVVVYSQNGKRVGLVVDRILDIVEVFIKERPVSSGDSILGSVVVEDRVTDVLDLNSILTRHIVGAPILMGVQHG